jgi:hypothetical protein
VEDALTDNPGDSDAIYEVHASEPMAPGQMTDAGPVRAPKEGKNLGSLNFHFQHDFANKPIDQAFDETLAWLKREGARKIRSTRPSKIDAIHGSHTTVSGWKRNAKKKMSFTLTRTANGVQVVATIAPVFANASDVSMMREEAMVNWGIMKEELWAIMEGRDRCTVAARYEMYTKEIAQVSANRGRQMTRRERGSSPSAYWLQPLTSC